MQARAAELEERGPAAYIAEFVGTFLLVVFISVAASQSGGTGVTDFAVIGLVNFLTLAVLVAVLGGVSGGHFNPAVSVALAALRRIAPADAVTYIVCQLAGGVAAALIVAMMTGDAGEVANLGALVPGEAFDMTVWSVGLAELLGTFLLMGAIMGTAVARTDAQRWAPLIIGGALGVGVLALGPLTGAGFNPARAFGPAIASGEFGAADVFIVGYLVAPVLGALAAAFGYQALALGPRGREGHRPVDTLDESPAERLVE
ncbi:MAG TPA: aquaporin [Solirubrobacteraceae bacterium]|nr:aquaporin [Solirubrobacteraceae bacterium]